MASAASRHPFAGIADGQLESGRVLEILYKKDPSPKTSLLDGIYRDEAGKAFVPSSVVKARKRLSDDPTWNHEYPPFLGQQSFLHACEELFFGCKSTMVNSGFIASMQTIGATGACHMGARFLKAHYEPWRETLHPKIYLPKDSWVNYRNVFREIGIECVDLPYYNSSTKTLDFHSFKTAIESLPLCSVVILQTSAHNPTGCDPSIDQWVELTQTFLNRRHFAFLDSAYLGLVSGDPQSSFDSGSIRSFAESGVPMLLAATFGKCFGLYGERVGILSLPGPSQEVRERMQRQMILLARSETGASPSFGAKIVEIILTDRELRNQWENDLGEMARQLKSRRKLLRQELECLGTPGEWDFITNQVGMFSYLGLREYQVDILRTDYHVYIDKSARICFGTLNTPTIKRVACSINNLLKAHQMENSR